MRISIDQQSNRAAVGQNYCTTVLLRCFAKVEVKWLK